MRTLREASILALVALVPAGLAVALHPQLADRARAGLEPDAVLLAEVRSWKTKVIWVDARAEADFAAGSIPGAVHLTEERFDAELGGVLGAWEPGRPVVVYCSTLSCGTSRAVAERLREAGLDEVFYLHGGWESWVEAVKP